MAKRTMPLPMTIWAGFQHSNDSSLPHLIALAAHISHQQSTCDITVLLLQCNCKFFWRFCLESANLLLCPLLFLSSGLYHQGYPLCCEVQLFTWCWAKKQTNPKTHRKLNKKPRITKAIPSPLDCSWCTLWVWHSSVPSKQTHGSH